LFLLVAGATVAGGLFAYLSGLRFIDDLERQTVDARFSVRGAQPARDVVVVDIDDVTFSDLNLRWPFPRRFHAQLLDRIRAGHPKAIAFDVQFTEPTDVKDDNALVEAVSRNRGRIVLATTEVGPNGSTRVLGGDDVLRQIGARAANANLPTDSDGVIRHFKYEIGGLKSFAVVAAGIARGREISTSEMGGLQQWIDYAGPPGTVTSYSYSRLFPEKVVHVAGGKGLRPWWVVVPAVRNSLVGQFSTRARAEEVARSRVVPANAFRDKVVVIGAGNAPSLQDLHTTPAGALMPGPEVQANAIETALHGFPLRSVARGWNVVLIILLALVVPFVGMRGSPLLAVGTGLLFAAVLVVGVQFAFNHGWIVAFVYPLGALVVSTFGSLGVAYTVAAFERERVRDVFSRFVPEQVVDQVVAQADSDLRLLGKEVVATVMFSDLRDFTASAERLPAADVIQVLNQYLHEMSDAILAHGGTLLSYMGDGIYALFGAPVEQEDHAARALAAAREMLTERLPHFNLWVREHGLGEGYLMGIGLNTGPVMTGNVGHARRMDYTAVGDVTNTASRIESMTKGTPWSVLIAQSTIEALKDPPSDLVYYDELVVRGREAKLKLWALDIRKPEAAPELAAAEESAVPAPVKGA
jgi:adenylate cyclase